MMNIDIQDSFQQIKIALGDLEARQLRLWAES